MFFFVLGRPRASDVRPFLVSVGRAVLVFRPMMSCAARSLRSRSVRVCRLVQGSSGGFTVTSRPAVLYFYTDLIVLCAASRGGSGRAGLIGEGK